MKLEKMGQSAKQLDDLLANLPQPGTPMTKPSVQKEFLALTNKGLGTPHETAAAQLYKLLRQPDEVLGQLPGAGA